MGAPGCDAAVALSLWRSKIKPTVFPVLWGGWVLVEHVAPSFGLFFVGGRAVFNLASRYGADIALASQARQKGPGLRFLEAFLPPCPRLAKDQ